METIYLIEYNDKFGNGDNKTIEGYITDQKDFDLWLEEHNKQREEEGSLEENKDEFDLIAVEYIGRQ